jgi:hypothetical protein
MFLIFVCIVVFLIMADGHQPLEHYAINVNVRLLNDVMKALLLSI